MGIYGYVIEEGMTDFPAFINNVPFFDIQQGVLEDS